MKRYLITSAAFTGEIQVLYGQDAKLLYIDFLNCEMTEEQISFFKNALPVYYSDDNFNKAFASAKSINIQEQGYRISFDQFWSKYNMKRNRLRCEKLWTKLSEADQVNAYFGLRGYDRHLMLNTWKTKADPDTYLRNRYWENEWK
jgi:hypothetical protein